METQQKRIIDPFNRVLNYLRVSITDQCNLRCIYCSPDGKIPKRHHSQILRYEEILRIIRVAVGLGVRKIRITGGEPLVRKGVCSFLEMLSCIEGIDDIGLTTNGTLLQLYAQKIYDAGVRRLNISLDTLDSKSYRYITGYNLLDNVLSGIELADKIGFSPIKINVVALKGINEDQLLNFAKLSIHHPYRVRFIEYMPIGNARLDPSEHILSHSIRKMLETLGELIQVEKGKHDGPADRYHYMNAKGEIGFISPISEHFCHQCNRLRLTADGSLRACLLSDRQLDIKSILRQNGSDEDIANQILLAAREKEESHHIKFNTQINLNTRMSEIGG